MNIYQNTKIELLGNVRSADVSQVAYLMIVERFLVFEAKSLR